MESLIDIIERLVTLDRALSYCYREFCCCICLLNMLQYSIVATAVCVIYDHRECYCEDANHPRISSDSLSAYT